MQRFPKILAGISLLLLLGFGFEWHEAASAKVRTQEIEQQLSHQTDLYNQQEIAIKQLQGKNDALVKQIDSPPQAVAASAPAEASSPASSHGPSAGGAAPVKGLLAQMLKDPAMSKALRDQQAWMIKKQYGDLMKQLKLTPDQSDQFYSIMNDQQAAAMSNGLNIISGGDKDALAKATQDATASTDSQLKALLGDDGFSQYKEFQDTLADRTLMEQFAPSFSDHPLTADQQQQLMQLMRTERQNAASVPGQTPTTIDPSDMAANMQRAMQQQEDQNQQVLQGAAAFLSPDQLQSLGNAQTNFLSLQKAGAAMAQSMMGGGSNAQSAQ